MGIVELVFHPNGVKWFSSPSYIEWDFRLGASGSIRVFVVGAFELLPKLGFS